MPKATHWVGPDGQATGRKPPTQNARGEKKCPRQKTKPPVHANPDLTIWGGLVAIGHSRRLNKGTYFVFPHRHRSQQTNVTRGQSKAKTTQHERSGYDWLLSVLVLMCRAARSDTAFERIASAFCDCSPLILVGGCMAVALETVCRSDASHDVVGVAGGRRRVGGGPLGGCGVSLLCSFST